MPNQFSNNASTTLASGITNSATSITVATGQGTLFPTPSGTNVFFATLSNTAGSTIEIVKVTARSTDTMTVVRAQEGTTAAAFSTGDKFELRITAGVLNAFGQQVGGAIALNATTLTSSVTIDTGYNGVAVGPLTVPTGMTITIASGQRLVVL